MQPNTFAQQRNVYTGFDAFQDVIGAVIDADNNRRGVNQPGQYNTLCACMIYPVTRDLIFACS